MPDYWIDCDFQVESKKAGRLMGYIPPDKHYMSGQMAIELNASHGEVLIPRSQWQGMYDEFDPNLARLATYTYDQNGYGTCTSNATSQAIAHVWALTYGPEWAITPAPPSLYPFCASGGNSGSSVYCNIKRATEVGVLLIDNEQNRRVLRTLGLNEDHVIDPVSWNAGKRCPQSWYEETAIHFRIKEWSECTNVDSMFSSVFRSNPVVYGRSGHAICGTNVDPVSGWTLIYTNSWGSWGRTINGRTAYGEDTTSYLQRTGAANGAVAIRALTEPPGIENLLAA